LKTRKKIRPIKIKYRPSIRTILFSVNIAVLLLPLASLAFLRLYDNQLVRETEAELISQAAVLGTVFQKSVMQINPAYEEYGVKLEGAFLPRPNERYMPASPRLDFLGASILPPRPDGIAAAQPSDETALVAGRQLYELFAEAQLTTLAGFRVLDARGTVIGGREEVGQSLAHLEEIRQAMNGRYASVLRKRATRNRSASLAALGGGTRVRLFVALPVIRAGHLWGIIYLSRTPDNVFRQLYATRYRLALTAIAVLAMTMMLAWIASRRILRPIDALSRQARGLASGNRAAMAPLDHYGTRELAALGDAFLEMASALEARANYIKNFAMHVSHEFKTPLTSIRGSAELLLDHMCTMEERDRIRFLNNIVEDTARLGALVTRLLELARADSAIPIEAATEACSVIDGIALTQSTDAFKIERRGVAPLLVPISQENFEIAVTNLIQNAAQNGATRIEIDLSETEGMSEIAFRDNGRGVSPGNRDKIFAPFFTTRREEGGTGLGLQIVQSLIEAHRGTVHLAPSEQGAVFVIRFPTLSES
jgi:signal transduction histidine kinase